MKLKAFSNLDNRRIIGSDLDRTLLNDQGELSKYTAKVLNYLTEEGHIIVPATSRSYTDLPESLLKSKVSYFACSNGAIVWDKNKDEVVLAKRMSKTLTLKILKTCASIKKVVTVTVDGVVYCEKGLFPLFSSRIKDPETLRKLLAKKVLVDDVTPYINKAKAIDKIHINFLDMINKEKCLESIKHFSQCYFTSSHPLNVEITAKGADKGSAILGLAKLHSISKSNIICFGDSDNDLKLLEVAAIKVAVNNAEDIIKEKADYISQFSNDEDAVALFLKDYFQLDF